MHALFFDLDGTLADTAGDLHAALIHVLKHFGRAPLPKEDMRTLIGGGARAILARGFAATGGAVSEEELERGFNLFIAHYDANINTHTKIFANLISVLEAAQKAGLRLAVITNKREAMAAKLLWRLKLHSFFELLIGGDTLAHNKPHPLPILEALRRLDVAPQNAIMIGDSNADVDAAKAASVASIAVGFGYSHIAPDQLGADALIDDFAELPSAVARLRPQIKF